MNRPTFALIATAAVCASALPASAQTAPDALGPRLQDARISGHGSTITIRRLPVRTPEGVVYRDITIELKLDASGAVSADAAGSPLPSPGHAAVAQPARDGGDRA